MDEKEALSKSELVEIFGKEDAQPAIYGSIPPEHVFARFYDLQTRLRAAFVIFLANREYDADERDEIIGFYDKALDEEAIYVGAVLKILETDPTPVHPISKKIDDEINKIIGVDDLDPIAGPDDEWPANPLEVKREPMLGMVRRLSENWQPLKDQRAQNNKSQKS